MARSSYIYLVTEKDQPVAAFTVKWEMESWVDRHPGIYRRFRMSDGLSGAIGVGKSPVEMSESADFRP